MYQAPIALHLYVSYVKTIPLQIEFYSTPNLSFYSYHVSEKRGKEAVKKILSKGHLSPEKVLYMNLDLASLDSVRAFAAALTKKFKSIDVLVNNAGIMALPNREVLQS